MYNLKGTVDFPTRIKHSTLSAIDNFIIDISQLDNYSVKPFSNDLSNHDAQILTIKIPVQSQMEWVKSIRKVDKYTIPEFLGKLSNETWHKFFHNEDINNMFNFFLDTYLKFFYASFPVLKTKSRNNGNNG